MWQALLSAGLQAGSSFLGKKLGTAVGSPETGALAGDVMQKIAGIPMPGQTGKELGRDAKAFYDEAFPGTNPWERLGGSGYPGGNVTTGREQQRTAERMQQKELATRERIADKQATAQTQSAAIAHGGKAVADVTDYRRGGPVPNYDTPSTIMARRFNEDVAKVVADTNAAVQRANRDYYEAIRSGVQADIEKGLVQYKNILRDARVAKELTPNTYAFLINAANNAAQGLYKAGNRFGQWFKEAAKNPFQTSAPAKMRVRGSTHYKNQ